jgi:pimeloyl-ACP methyl ester carboxylesterase
MTAVTDLPYRSIAAGGFELAVVDRGSGEAVLMLHGFPSSAMDWRHQIPALVAAGYRVIAPDLLGLGRSPKPTEIEHYTAALELARAVALLDTLGIARAHIVCHDRGAGIGWGLAALHPQRVGRVVVMNVGHPNVFRDPSIAQREKSWYMLLFQLDCAEEMLREDDWRLFRQLTRHYPDTDAWIADLAPDGALTAALAWYRANRHPAAPRRPPLPDVTIPALGLWAPDDHYLLPETMLESHRFVRGPWRTERIDGASHFMMVDRPDYVTRFILDFLGE